MRSDAESFTFGFAHTFYICELLERECALPTICSYQFEGEGEKGKKEEKEKSRSKGIFIFILLKTWEIKLTVFLAAPQPEPKLTPLCRSCPQGKSP